MLLYRTILLLSRTIIIGINFKLIPLKHSFEAKFYTVSTHDIFIHQRFKLFRNANNWYARGVRRAHKIHHKHLGKEHGENFGMLVVPFKYFKK